MITPTTIMDQASHLGREMAREEEKGGKEGPVVQAEKDRMLQAHIARDC